MSEPTVGKENEKKNRRDAVEAFKGIGRVAAGIFGLSCAVVGFLAGYYAGLDKAGEAAKAEMTRIEERIGKRVDADQAVIKVIEEEQRRVRQYLQEAQVIASEAFRTTCNRQQGSYSPNDKTCTYALGPDRVVVERFPFLASQDPNYPLLPP